MNDTESVLVVSTDRLFRETTALYLQRRGWRVTTAADSLQALVALARSLPGAVLVLEGRDHSDARALVGQIRRRFPAVSVTIVGNASIEGNRALPRTATGRQVIDALRSATQVTPEVGAQPHPVDRDGIRLLRTLTPRERRILSYLTAGASRAEIARRLDLSEHTVRTHQQNLHRKLKVHSRLELIRFASLYGFLGSDEEDRVV